jgi:hypothetical protein
MNTDRLLRDIEGRLQHLSPADRAEAVDAVREEVARFRRREGPAATVEVERERRQEAETLRAVLEAINHQASLEETIDEVLRQLAKLVPFDSCSIALLDADDHFRIIAARGYADDRTVVGLAFKDALTDMLRRSHAPVAVGDVIDDQRFRVKFPGTPDIRSWAGIPLLVEGEVIGLLNLDRHRVDPFDDEDLHRAKAVAFSAAAAIRKAQLHEKLRRYAALMERLVAVDQAVFAGKPEAEVSRLILDGALHVGPYSGGLLAIAKDGKPAVAAASDGLGVRPGAVVPAALVSPKTTRLSAAQAARLPGLRLPKHGVFVVPLTTPEAQIGALALVDGDGASPDDRLMEAYAARAAAAYVHATRRASPPPRAAARKKKKKAPARPRAKAPARKTRRR